MCIYWNINVPLTSSTVAFEYSIVSLVLTPHCSTTLLVSALATIVICREQSVGLDSSTKPGITPRTSLGRISSAPELVILSILRGWERGLQSTTRVQVIRIRCSTGTLQSRKRQFGRLCGPQTPHSMSVSN